MSAAAQIDRIRELNDRAVAVLIQQHAARTDEPLVLGVRYAMDDASDIGLLEVLGGFPGGDEDELLVTEFEPSASLRILGTLRLVLASPAQLRAALARNDVELERARTGSVVFDRDDTESAELRSALGM